jgi:hypothetical protein
MKAARSFLWILAAIGAAAHAGNTPYYVSPVPPAQTAILARDPDNLVHTLYSESHAILIGQIDYTNWEPLNTSKTRILELRDALEKHRFKVEVYFDIGADQFASVLDSFMRRRATVPDSRIFVFVSGHGFSRTPLDRPVGYLVPFDAPAENTGKQALAAASLAMPYFTSWARLPDPRHMLFVFDACFSGSFFGRPALGVTPPEGIAKKRAPRFVQAAPPTTRGPEVDDYIFQAKTLGKGRQFLTAGSQGEVVPADSKFTRLLIDILNGGRAAEASINFDHWTTGSELGTWLEQNTRRLYDGAENATSPVFAPLRDETYEGGDMIFTRLDIDNNNLITQPENPATRPSDDYGPVVGLPRFEPPASGPVTQVPSGSEPAPASPSPPISAGAMPASTEMRIQQQINALSSSDAVTRRTARAALSDTLAGLPEEQRSSAVQRLLRQFSAKSYRFQLGISKAIASQPMQVRTFDSPDVRAELLAAQAASKDKTLRATVKSALEKIGR